MSGTLYTCGRVHKPHKLKLKPHSANANAVIDAVHKIMQEELSQAARERWCSRLDAELGKGTFGPTQTLDVATVAVLRVWMPAKPKLALALLDEFLKDHDDPQAPPPPEEHRCRRSHLQTPYTPCDRTAALQQRRRLDGGEW